MKQTLAVFLLLFAATTSAATLEHQLRSDLETIYRASWKPDQITPEALSRAIENAIAEAKERSPSLIDERIDRASATTAQIEKLLGELVRIEGRDPGYGLFPFYLRWWRAEQLKPNQMVLFARLLQIRIQNVRPERK